MKNVLLDFPATKRFYLTHPWVFIKDCFRNLRSAWERATKGYCRADLYEMCDWMLDTLGDAFSAFADENFGYPDREPFKDFDSWQAWIRKTANTFHNATDHALEERNEYKEEFDKYLFGLKWSSEPDPEHSTLRTLKMESSLPPDEEKSIRDRYWNRDNELRDERTETLKQTFNEIADNFFDLWI